jgi:hypothetical protein
MVTLMRALLPMTPPVLAHCGSDDDVGAMFILHIERGRR